MPIRSIPYIALDPNDHTRPLQPTLHLNLFLFRRFTLPIFWEQPSSALSIEIGIFTPVGDALEQGGVRVRIDSAFEIEKSVAEHIRALNTNRQSG
jgi:hypothetical protein